MTATSKPLDLAQFQPWLDRGQRITVAESRALLAECKGLRAELAEADSIGDARKETIKRQREKIARLREALAVSAEIFAAPQNRFGKQEFYTDDARVAREALRLLAVRYDVAEAYSIPQQASQVARAALNSTA